MRRPLTAHPSTGEVQAHPAVASQVPPPSVLNRRLCLDDRTDGGLSGVAESTGEVAVLGARGIPPSGDADLAKQPVRVCSLPSLAFADLVVGLHKRCGRDLGLVIPLVCLLTEGLERVSPVQRHDQRQAGRGTALPPAADRSAIRITLCLLCVLKTVERWLSLSERTRRRGCV